MRTISSRKKYRAGGGPRRGPALSRGSAAPQRPKNTCEADRGQEHRQTCEGDEQPCIQTPRCGGERHLVLQCTDSNQLGARPRLNGSSNRLDETDRIAGDAPYELPPIIGRIGIEGLRQRTDIVGLQDARRPKRRSDIRPTIVIGPSRSVESGGGTARGWYGPQSNRLTAGPPPTRARSAR